MFSIVEATTDEQLLSHVMHLRECRATLLAQSKQRKRAAKATKMKFESKELEDLFNKLPPQFQRLVMG